jgi:hypothetical protein
MDNIKIEGKFWRTWLPRLQSGFGVLAPEDKASDDPKSTSRTKEEIRVRN